MDQNFRPVSGGLPQLFGDEGHHRMQQDHALVQHPAHGGAGFRRRRAIKQRFGKFDVPVADLAPDKGIQRVRRVIKAVLGQRRIHLNPHPRGLADDPAVGGGGGGRGRGRCHMPLPDAIHLGKAAGVPQLGREVAIAGNALGIQLQHPAQTGHCRIGKAQAVGPVLIDDLQGVDDIAQRFGHFLALGVADKPVQIDGVERNIVHHRKLHHHHPGDPEEQDILPGHKHRGREVFRQFRRGVRPAQRADRPEAGGEPGVEDVGVAAQPNDPPTCRVEFPCRGQRVADPLKHPLTN